MPRVCTICTHSDRGEIDRALVANETIRSIAKQHAVSSAAVLRHKQHLPAELVNAKQAEKVADADRTLAYVARLQDRIERWIVQLDAAQTPADRAERTKLTREARETAALLAKLRGELQGGTVVNVNAVAAVQVQAQPSPAESAHDLDVFRELALSDPEMRSIVLGLAAELVTQGHALPLPALPEPAAIDTTGTEAAE